jgi:hypothetical protein
VITRLSFILLFIFVLAGLMLNFYYLHGREKASLPGFKVNWQICKGKYMINSYVKLLIF